MDERDKSIITWREAHTEAVGSKNGLWTKILETDKKLYEPLRPRVFDELPGVRFVLQSVPSRIYTRMNLKVICKVKKKGFCLLLRR